MKSSNLWLFRISVCNNLLPMSNQRQKRRDHIIPQIIFCHLKHSWVGENKIVSSDFSDLFFSMVQSRVFSRVDWCDLKIKWRQRIWSSWCLLVDQEPSLWLICLLLSLHGGCAPKWFASAVHILFGDRENTFIPTWQCFISVVHDIVVKPHSCGPGPDHV